MPPAKKPLKNQPKEIKKGTPMLIDVNKIQSNIGKAEVSNSLKRVGKAQTHGNPVVKKAGATSQKRQNTRSAVKRNAIKDGN